MNIDGGWWKGHYTGTAVRNSSGYLEVKTAVRKIVEFNIFTTQFDEKAFPKGMKALGDFYHSKGLLFG